MNTTTRRPFVIARQLKVPRQLVWDAYTQTAHLQHWFGPKGVTLSHGAMDFRVGRFTYELEDDGTGVYRVVAVQIELPNGTETVTD